ncbi:hypothetical protein EDD18DRAFT_1079546, partial [Armillaria luteobubalina]
NRTVPILDVLQIPDEKDMVLLVMPKLRDFNSPHFHYHAEVVKVIYHILEGLDFMHKLKIFHNDACIFNFMMDATKVCPKGFHFAQKLSVNSVHYKLPNCYHCCVAPVQYYIINFESSKEMEEG